MKEGGVFEKGGGAEAAGGGGGRGMGEKGGEGIEGAVRWWGREVGYKGWVLRARKPGSLVYTEKGERGTKRKGGGGGVWTYFGQVPKKPPQVIKPRFSVVATFGPLVEQLEQLRNCEF